MAVFSFILQYFISKNFSFTEIHSHFGLHEYTTQYIIHIRMKNMPKNPSNANSRTISEA